MIKTPRATPIATPALAPVDIPVFDDADDDDAELVADDASLEDEVADARPFEPLLIADAVEEDVVDEVVLDTQEGSSEALSMIIP